MKSKQDKQINQDQTHLHQNLTQVDSRQENEAILSLQQLQKPKDQFIKAKSLEVNQEGQKVKLNTDDCLKKPWTKEEINQNERQKDCKKEAEDFYNSNFSDDNLFSEQVANQQNQDLSAQYIYSQKDKKSTFFSVKRNGDDKNENKNSTKSQKYKRHQSFKSIFKPTSQGEIYLAKLHQQAKKIKKIDFREIRNEDLCDCCGLPIEGQNYSLNCSIEEFASFGIGFSLYFIYLKFVIILLFLGFIPFGLVI